MKFYLGQKSGSIYCPPSQLKSIRIIGGVIIDTKKERKGLVHGSGPRFFFQGEGKGVGVGVDN